MEVVSMMGSSASTGAKEVSSVDLCNNDEENKENKQNEENKEKKSKYKIEEPAVEKTLEEYKLEVDAIVKYLQECTDYATEECFEKFKDLAEMTKNRYLRNDIALYLIQEHKYEELFIKVWNSLWTEDIYNNEEKKQASKNLRKFKAISWNFTDFSPEFCNALLCANILDTLIIKELDNQYLEAKSLQKESKRMHIKGTFGILTNCVRLNSACKPVYRKANAVELVANYVQSTFLIIKSKAFILLSYIVNEHENDTLKTTNGSVSFILNLITEALRSKDHIGATYKYSVTELLEAVIQLARHDTNKVKIGIQGGIYIICRVLVAAFSDEEQVLAAKALWSLSFVDINRQIIKLSDIGMKALKELHKSEIPELGEACIGTLWEVFGSNKEMFCNDSDLQLNSESKGVDNVSEDQPRGLQQDGPHIMISYQWDMQERMLELRDQLKSSGYNIWMDVDKMEGDLLVAMADAVEKSAVVLVCMTRKYKDSQNCRTEASYAYKQNKALVPLLLEEDYVPDGWLGALTGMLKYFKFLSDEQLYSQMPYLTNELGDRGKVGSRAIVPTKAVVVNSAPRKISVNQDTPDGPVNVTKWSSNDVEKWLKSKDLSSVQAVLQKYNGSQLNQMYKQFRKAPDFFLASLKSDLKMDYFTILNFTAALEELFSN